MTNVLIDMEESGDSCNSDVEGKLFKELDEAVCKATVDKMLYLEEEEQVAFSNQNIHINIDKKSEKNNNELSDITPFISTNWKPDERKGNKQEPEFNTVDNPSGWSQFIFRADCDSIAKDGNYNGHFLRTGTTPVPVSSEVYGLGELPINNWKFDCKE